MRFAAPHHQEPDGKQIWLTSNGALCCPHGELSSTICYWLAAEKAARSEGRTPGPRGGGRTASACDCQNTDGLNAAAGDAVKPPEPPSSLFAYLEEQQAAAIMVRGREARRVPHLGGPTFVTTMGALVCRHGRSREVLSSAAKKPAPRTLLCDCVLQALPARRGAFGGVQLGKFARKCRAPPAKGKAASARIFAATLPTAEAELLGVE